MRKLSTKVKHFVIHNKWWSGLIGIIILFIAYQIFNSSKTTPPVLTAVSNRNITEVVSTTGNVTPLADIQLSFRMSGQISDVAVSVGDNVSAGQYIAELSNADLAAAVEQAKAGLKGAQAQLASLQSGSTPQQVAVSQSQVSQAQSTLTQTENNLENTIGDAYTVADDSVRNKTDVMINNPQSQNPTLQFQADFSLTNVINTERISVENILNTWNGASMLSTSSISVNTAVSNLQTIKQYLDNLALAVNGLTTATNIDAATIVLWKSDVSTARTNVATVIASLSAAQNAYMTAQSALTIAQNQLAVTTTGATTDQLNVQEALVEQAQAGVDSAQAAFDKSIIVSPITGVITEVNNKTGETVQSGQNIISVISYGAYQVEAYVAEADIAKIQVGDIATTTLDAYGSDTFFTTKVIKIDPAETVIENVPTYKVTFEFIAQDDRVRSGMTANLDVLTNQKNNVLAIPSRSVYLDGTDHKVQIYDPITGKVSERIIVTGIRGVDGYVEVVSGLKEGDQILASPTF